MLKRLFAWRFTPVVILLFYGLGAFFWYFALESNFHRHVFYAAGACFAVGLLWSLGWVWKGDLFRAKRSMYSSRYSDHQPNERPDIASRAYAKTHGERRRSSRPRKSKKKLRSWATVWCLLLFVGVCVPLWMSYRDFVVASEQGGVEIFLSDGQRTMAAGAPLVGRSAQSKDLVFALAGIPVKSVQIHPGDKVARVDVVVRNVSAVDIRNADIEVHGTVRIKAVGDGVVSISDKDLGVHAESIPSYRHGAKEITFGIEVPIQEQTLRDGLYVTVTGDNLPEYAAVANIRFVEIRPPAGTWGQLPVARDGKAAIAGQAVPSGAKSH